MNIEAITNLDNDNLIDRFITVNQQVEFMFENKMVDTAAYKTAVRSQQNIQAELRKRMQAWGRFTTPQTQPDVETRLAGIERHINRIFTMFESMRKNDGLQVLWPEAVSQRIQAMDDALHNIDAITGIVSDTNTVANRIFEMVQSIEKFIKPPTSDAHLPTRDDLAKLRKRTQLNDPLPYSIQLINHAQIDVLIKNGYARENPS